MTKLYRPVGNKTLFPIGYIYLSMDSTNPATLFGGTWTQIKSRMLYCYTASGQTGGEERHTLTVSEMPSHEHGLRVTLDLTQPAANERAALVGGGSVWASGDTYQIGNTGGSSSHNNMPPYITVYGWYRTA